MPQFTRDRDRVGELATSQPSEALTIARKIDKPWFRCQALAYVAHHWRDPDQRNCILKESFQAALEAEGPNRIVTVSSWPLKVLCKSRQDEWLTTEVSRLLGIIGREPSPVRRADALSEMLGALIDGPPAVFWNVFGPFEQACSTPLLNGKRNARGQSRLALWLAAVDRLDPLRAQRLLQAISGPTRRARAEECMKEHEKTALEELYGWPRLC